jgi:hypothetical protein
VTNEDLNDKLMVERYNEVKHDGQYEKSKETAYRTEFIYSLDLDGVL